MYYVAGGRYTDTHFDRLIDDTGEWHGPFNSYEQAFEEWRARMFAQIDDSHFRLFVTEHPERIVTPRVSA